MALLWTTTRIQVHVINTNGSTC